MLIREVKSVLQGLVAGALFLALTAAAAFAQDSLLVSSASGAPGDDVEVTVTLSSVNTVSELKFQLVFDPAIIQVREAEAAGDASDLVLDNLDIETANLNGRLAVRLTSDGQDGGLAPGSGLEILAMELTVGEQAEGDIPVTLDSVSVLDESSQALEVSLVDGIVTVVAETSGDGGEGDDDPEEELYDLDIGEVLVGSSGSGSFYVVNDAEVELVIDSIKADNPVFSVDISPSVDISQVIIDPLDSLEVTVTFTPLTEGPASAIVAVWGTDVEVYTILSVTVGGTGTTDEPGPTAEGGFTADPELLEDFVAYGLEYLILKTRGEVSGGNIGANERGLILDVDSKVYGSVKTPMDVFIHNRMLIDGDVVYGGDIKGGQRAEITGSVIQESLTPLEFSVSDFSAGGEYVRLKGRERLNLEPGSYDVLVMKSKSELTLSNGDYYFNRLLIGSGANVLFDLTEGPVHVYVVEDMVVKSKSTMSIVSEEGKADQVFFLIKGDRKAKGEEEEEEEEFEPGADPGLQISLQADWRLSVSRIGSGAKFLGIVIAPNSRLWVQPKAEVEGALYAKLLSLGVNSRLSRPSAEPVEGEEALLSSARSSSSAPRLPKAFALAQNYPNPFNPSTSITFAVGGGESVSVRLAVYDIRGRLVRTLVEGNKTPGSYSVDWDGRDSQGRSVASGIYFYRIKAGVFEQTRKMVLLK